MLRKNTVFAQRRTIHAQTNLNIRSEGMEIQAIVLSIPNLLYDLILGAVTLINLNAVINFKNNTLIFSINKNAHY